MKVAINVRGIDHRGEFTIITRVEASGLLQGLDLALKAWEIDRTMLTKVHVEPDKIQVPA